MPRSRRYIKSRALYEISFRALNSIPLICSDYMNAIVTSILARVQRDSKVVLHHYAFEGSHPHMFCTALDAEKCKQFYGEIKKQITEAVKRLLGIDRLNLWEDRPSVILIPTLEDAIDKIVYIYTNPSNDNLEESIERYPGLTSWKGFLYGLECPSASCCYSVPAPWIRQTMIPRLPGNGEITERQDKFIAQKMLALAKRREHSLDHYPNSWLAALVPDANRELIEDTNNQILQLVRERERENHERRKSKGQRVMGAYRLKTQRLLKPHIPKKRGRKIFVHTQFNNIRLEEIEERHIIEMQCRYVFSRWRMGETSVPWPPGTYPPSLPVLCNLIE